MNVEISRFANVAAVCIFVLVTTVETGCRLGCTTSESFSLPGPTLARLQKDDVDVLLRYFAGNERWEVKPGEPTVVIRKEERENYRPTLNGFYGSPRDAKGLTRVLVSVGSPTGIEGFDCVSSFSANRTGRVRVQLAKPKTGQPGFTSLVVLRADNVSVEVYEQSLTKSRLITEAALIEVVAEVEEALRHRDEIETTGRAPVPDSYPLPRVDNAQLSIVDGPHLGVYQVNAWVNPGVPGDVFLRVVEASTERVLAEDKVESESIRSVGWSTDPKALFPYSSEVTITGGASEPFEAVFELWHRDDQRREKRMLQGVHRVQNFER